MNLFVCAGTTEGTDFVQKAVAAGHIVTVSMATSYGKALLQRALMLSAVCHNVNVLQGRLSEDELCDVVRPFDAIVDATHPYAEVITKNLLSASKTTAVPYYRLLRPVQISSYEKLHEFTTLTEIAADLVRTSGNIFITTGSKELSCFTVIPDYKNRLFVRVLPLQESLEKCTAAGFEPSHIIAMQGTFSESLNKALFMEYDCRILVTKESGIAGGFAEKIAAATALNMDVYAIKPPLERGPRIYDSAEQLLQALVR